MALSLVRSRTLVGLQAHPVCVEVHLANGLPSFTLVGLADTEVKEARERVRSAIQNAGLVFPSNQRITVNLAPADVPKDSGRFDLPIALGILAASGQIDSAALAGYEFAGELSLGGELRPIRGALAMSLSAPTDGTRASTPTQWVLPPGSAEEAALVDGVCVYRARHLLDVVRQFAPTGHTSDSTPPDPDGWLRLQPRAPASVIPTGPDLADVKGQAAARRALEIAAAGGHSLLLVGPPGSGKSMLAQRFAGLLPAMSTAEALESAAVASLSGRFRQYSAHCAGASPGRLRLGRAGLCRRLRRFDAVVWLVGRRCAVEHVPGSQVGGAVGQERLACAGGLRDRFHGSHGSSRLAPGRGAQEDGCRSGGRKAAGSTGALSRAPHAGIDPRRLRPPF